MRFHFRLSITPLVMPLLVSGHFGPAFAAETPEDPFFSELPVVLSVTRLAQSLQDTPGAVTVIDREMIRKSGAREVAELLRLVPGFVVSYVDNGGRPVANYHASLDQFGGRHMQVLVDGRSVYSSLYIGDTHRGLMGVVLDDVERIEVLRGSNSAAYGANAFLGVINIVTRNAADSHGGYLSYTGGMQGVSDYVARVGGGVSNASYRLTVAKSRDDGATTFRTPSDQRVIQSAREVEKTHLRADFQPTLQDDVSLGIGQTVHRHDKGEPSNDSPNGNPPRNESLRASYVHLRWTHQLSPAESLQLAANLDEESYDEQFLLSSTTPFTYATLVGATGFSRRQSVEVQYTANPTAGVRVVSGMGLRHESLNSALLFTTRRHTQTQNQKRIFSNVEWRIAPAWLLNFGGLYEAHSETGGDFLPRVMLNYQPSPAHTFRIGETKATRAPSIFESRANQRLFDINTGTELPYDSKIIASGNLKPERIHSRELGYLLNLAELRATLDVRVFKEEIRDLISLVELSSSRDFVNEGQMDIRGAEYQLRWKPHPDTQIILNNTRTKVTSDTSELELRAPRKTTSLALFQRLPLGLDLALMHSRTSSFSLNKDDDLLEPISQTSVRLGYPFKLGSKKLEFSVVGQNINGKHLENQRDVLVKRRVFANLKVEF